MTVQGNRRKRKTIKKVICIKKRGPCVEVNKKEKGKVLVASIHKYASEIVSLHSFTDTLHSTLYSVVYIPSPM